MSDTQFDFGTVIEDAKKVITNPGGFYSEMPRTGGFANPLIFAVVMAAISGLIMAILSMVGLMGINPIVGGGVGLAMVIMLPIGVAIGSFIGAAIVFVIWKLMGSEHNYEVAYRCVAYSMAIMPIISVLSIIPYIASIVRGLWTCYLMYLASLNVHALKEQTAKIVWGVLAAIMVIGGFNSERTARKWGDIGSRYEAAMHKEYKDGQLGKVIKDLENMDEMTPEEAGEKFGEMLKGVGKFGEAMEKSIKEQEEAENDKQD